MGVLSPIAIYYPVNTIKYFEPEAAPPPLPDNHKAPDTKGSIVGKFVNIADPKEAVDVKLELTLPEAVIWPSPLPDRSKFPWTVNFSVGSFVAIPTLQFEPVANKTNLWSVLAEGAVVEPDII